MKKFSEGLKGTYAGKMQVKLCLKNNDYFDNASEDTDPWQGTSSIYIIQSNFHAQPPLISNHLQ